MSRCDKTSPRRAGGSAVVKDAPRRSARRLLAARAVPPPVQPATVNCTPGCPTNLTSKKIQHRLAAMLDLESFGTTGLLLQRVFGGVAGGLRGIARGLGGVTSGGLRVLGGRVNFFSGGLFAATGEDGNEGNQGEAQQFFHMGLLASLSPGRSCHAALTTDVLQAAPLVSTVRFYEHSWRFPAPGAGKGTLSLAAI